MHPRLSRTIGILILGVMTWVIGLGIASTGDDAGTILIETPWWSSLAMVIGAAGMLTTLACIVLIAVGMIRGTYQRDWGAD